MADFVGLEDVNARRVEPRFEEFPQIARDRILATLSNIEQRLEAAVRGAEPVRTGRLQSETGGRVYDHGRPHVAAVVVTRAPADRAARECWPRGELPPLGTAHDDVYCGPPHCEQIKPFALLTPRDRALFEHSVGGAAVCNTQRFLNFRSSF